MQLTDVYRALGRDRFEELIKSVSMGSLRTYQAYESFKVHTRLNKFNRERLRRAIPQLWSRLEEGDEDLALELSQGILISHLSFVAEALDHLGIAHDGNGFYEKNEAAAAKLTSGWQQKLCDQFRGAHAESLVLLYINHLDWELQSPTAPFIPTS